MSAVHSHLHESQEGWEHHILARPAARIQPSCCQHPHAGKNSRLGQREAHGGQEIRLSWRSLLYLWPDDEFYVEKLVIYYAKLLDSLLSRS